MGEWLKYLSDHKYFDVEGFMHWLQKEFPEPMSTPFTRELVMNIMNEAADEYTYNDGQFLSRLVNMIPQLTWDDVVQFADDLMITSE